MKEQLDIKVKTEQVFEAASKYLPTIMERIFITKEEAKEYGEDYIYIDDSDCVFYGGNFVGWCLIDMFFGLGRVGPVFK